jgi:hypothetical protein
MKGTNAIPPVTRQTSDAHTDKFLIDVRATGKEVVN